MMTRLQEADTVYFEYTALRASFERKYGIDPVSKVAPFFLPAGESGLEAMAARAEVNALRMLFVRY